MTSLSSIASLSKKEQAIGGIIVVLAKGWLLGLLL